MRSVKPIRCALAALALSTSVASAQEHYLGTIQSFGFNFCPRGWLEADGRLLPISQHTALFSLLGTIYGGDGRTTFALPDLRGATVMGAGTGPGLPTYQQGRSIGLNETTSGVQARVVAVKTCVNTDGLFPSRS